MWPSLGLVHGSRSSNDIKRDWKRIATTARQNLSRNWQNGRLWWNDPDAVVLTGDLPLEEIRFHATAIYATGGMLLSGDDLSAIDRDRLGMLQRLLPPTALAARFADDSMRVGTIDTPDARVACVLNWDDTASSVSFTVSRPSHVKELWSNEDLGRREGAIEVGMPPRGGRVFVCRPA
jgi:alpha-galactosidase